MPTATTRVATISRIKDTLLLLSALLSASLLLHLHLLSQPPPAPNFSITTQSSQSTPLPPSPPPPLSVPHLLFSIASSALSLPSRTAYLRLWHTPISHHNTTLLFLDRQPILADPSSMPKIIVQSNSNSISPGHRIAKVVKDAFTHTNNSNYPDIYWYVFGDDDTVFFVDNLVRVLSKYDHNRWYYIGCPSESYEQNDKFSFDMAFGGGGFAISASLMRVLARVMDSCLSRYKHLYGSDARIFACIAELGVRLTVEPGFHQVDIRGDLFGMLSAHPLSPLLSLHHIDAVEPIFPGMSRINGLKHLLQAAHANPASILQQTVCYDRTNSLTVSISWGYAIQVYEGNKLLPEILSLQRTFRPWRRGKNTSLSRYMFNTRELNKDQCKRPIAFFLHSVVTDPDGVWTHYRAQNVRNCSRGEVIKKLKVISVFTRNSDPDIEQMIAPRRDCCDVISTFDENMIMHIRKCGMDELIAMHEESDAK